MNMFDQYFSLESEILKYFEFEDLDTHYIIDDRREWSWKVINNSVVEYGEKDDFDNNNKEDLFRDDILKSEFLKKSIYKRESYTLIVIDTKMDFNNFLAIYDNSKELK